MFEKMNVSNVKGLFPSQACIENNKSNLMIEKYLSLHMKKKRFLIRNVSRGSNRKIRNLEGERYEIWREKEEKNEVKERK